MATAQTTFKSFSTTPNEDVISGRPKTKTFPAWSDLPSDVDTVGQASLVTFYTKSAYVGKLTLESNYFWNIYEADPNSDSSQEPQFSIAFGTTSSFAITSSTAYTSGDEDIYTYPSYATYRQMVNTVTNGGSYTKWGYTNESGASVTPGNVYIISMARARTKDYIEPANSLGVSSWQINFATPNRLVALTCQSASSTNQTSYNIITGTGSAYSGPNPSGTFGSIVGRFYSDKGLFILDSDKLYTSGATSLSPTITPATVYYIPSRSLYNLYAGISGGQYFKARSVEKVQSTHYFVRAKNYEFNYSNNPTWVSGSDNEVLTEFYEEQKTFITSVGLYDGDPNVEGSGQLVAIAKLSKPILKTPDTEILIKTRLDFAWFALIIPTAYSILHTLFI